MSRQIGSQTQNANLCTLPTWKAGYNISPCMRADKVRIRYEVVINRYTFHEWYQGVYILIITFEEFFTFHN